MRLCCRLAAQVALLMLAVGTHCLAASADTTMHRAAPTRGARTERPALSLEGSYRNAANTAMITFQTLTGDFYYVVSTQGWEGVGILSGVEYEGVFRETKPGHGTGLGRQVIYLRDDGGLEVHFSYNDAPEEDFVERWHRAREGEKPRPPFETPREPGPPSSPDPPPSGEYVYVEEMPEAIHKVQPIYPDMAREAGVEGSVLVQAHVLEDGTVGDTKVLKSIPMLDAAAVAAVRQWRFNPARSKDRAVAVWVAVPILFPPRTDSR